MIRLGKILKVCLILLPTSSALADVPSMGTEGARVIKEKGYAGCIELSNDRVRVVLEPNMGGRVLTYELDGVNVLYWDDGQQGFTAEDMSREYLGPWAGRFDLGPEQKVPLNHLSWLGRYEAEITGPRRAQLTGPRDPELGIQLVRKFELADHGSQLICRQEIHNISDEVVRFSHWSRTLAVGHGIVLLPDNKASRLPSGYLMVRPGQLMELKPEDPAIQRRDGVLEIRDTPSHSKLLMDPDLGWSAYLAPNDLLFVKTFPVYPNLTYGEISGATYSVWYYKDQMVELEPIGPWDPIEPGGFSSFTETWYLESFPFPENREVDIEVVKQRLLFGESAD